MLQSSTGEMLPAWVNTMRRAGWGTRQVKSAVAVGARRALPALAFGALTLPDAAFAETAQLSLPEVSVIGTSPLSTVRRARPTGGGAPGAQAPPQRPHPDPRRRAAADPA